MGDALLRLFPGGDVAVPGAAGVGVLSVAAAPVDTPDTEAVLEYLELAVLLNDRERRTDAAALDRLAIAAHPARARPEAGGHPSVATRANERGYTALQEERYEDSVGLCRICVDHYARLADLEGEVLGLENIYLALRGQREYTAALAILVQLVRPLVEGKFDDKLRNYLQEINSAVSVLESKPAPVVRDWRQDEDLRAVVAAKGADALTANGVLLVDRNQDILEILGMVEPEERRQFAVTFIEEIRRRTI
jgi:hypothetical protein